MYVGESVCGLEVGMSFSSGSFPVASIKSSFIDISVQN